MRSWMCSKISFQNMPQQCEAIKGDRLSHAAIRIGSLLVDDIKFLGLRCKCSLDLDCEKGLVCREEIVGGRICQDPSDSVSSMVV